MYWRFQADNFFVTTITNDQTLVPWQDGIINALELPNIEPWKLFYVIFRVDNVDNRFTLPVYLEDNKMKYKGYNVKSQVELKAYDTISLNDLAENFNYLFKNIDDIWTIVKKWWLDILVYGWIIIKWWINIEIADANITLADNTTQYIVFDYSDWTLKAVNELDNLFHYCFAEVTTFGWEVTDIVLKKSFNGWEIFSKTYFERNQSTWAIQLKHWAISKDDIDLSTLTSDDIEEWDENKYFKKSVYDPNNKNADVFNMDNMNEWTVKWSVIKSATAPENPTKWMTWYDTTENILKAYNWSTWESASSTVYHAWEGIEIANVDYSAMRWPADEWYHILTNDEYMALLNTLRTLGIETQNWSSYMKTYLKMPYAGNRGLQDANVYDQGEQWHYWLCTAVDDNRSYCFRITDDQVWYHDYCGRITFYHSTGYSLRCVKDLPVAPDGTWTILYDWSSVAAWAWIFHSSDLWLISLSADWESRLTIQDKNLWATTVYNDGDELSEANCGKYYERWNDYWFPWSWTITNETRDKADITWYWPRDHYSSDIYRHSALPPYNWATTSTSFLRWGFIWVQYNSIKNTWVLSVNWQNGHVIVDEGNTKTFYLANSSDLTTAQAIYDWYSAWKNPIVVFGWENYVYYNYTIVDSTTSLLNFTTPFLVAENSNSGGDSNTYNKYLEITIVDGSVTQYTYGAAWPLTKYLRTDTDYGNPYTPLYNWSPATKKYVDDSIEDNKYIAWEGIELSLPTRWPAPEWFHIPTSSEYSELISIIKANHVADADIGNFLKSYLFMPLNDYRIWSSWAENWHGWNWYYWCSNATHDATFPNDAYCIQFIDSGSYDASVWIYTMEKACWLSLRCFKDIPVSATGWHVNPEAGWTRLAAWVYHNADKWLISITRNNQNWITIADKNLGATQIYHDWDTLSESNCGWYYQRWNNYMFPYTWTVTTSATKVDGSNYWPWRYYYNSTYITGGDWSSVENDNLWWWETWVQHSVINAIADNTKTFFLASTSDLATAQAAYDWYAAGKSAIIMYNWDPYFYYTIINWNIAFKKEHTLVQQTEASLYQFTVLLLCPSGTIITRIETTSFNDGKFVLMTNTDYGVPYMAQYDGSPVTKKYLDKRIVSGSTAPASPTEGALWYDTTNDVLKSYDGTNWNTVWDDTGNINTKTFTLASDSDLTTAQNILDWYIAGKNPIVLYWWETYNVHSYTTSSLSLVSTFPGVLDVSTYSVWKFNCLNFSITDWIVTLIGTSSFRNTTPQVLATNVNYNVPYQPQYDGSPATKKYVDDQIEDNKYTAWEGIEIIKNDYSAMKWPAPEGYHVPSIGEFRQIRDILDGLWIDSSALDSAKTYLKLPQAWVLVDYGVLFRWGDSWFNYRTCTATINSNEQYADKLGYYNSAINYDSASWRGTCYPIRAFKDDPVVPNAQWTVLYNGGAIATWAWIFHSSTLWLISLSSDWQNRLTIADKNLWATVAYNSWDALTDNNCWWYFQWWNNHMFPGARPESIISTPIDASWYGPWNYYSSSDYYYVNSSNNDWDSSHNKNLWWWVTWAQHNVINASADNTKTFTLSWLGSDPDVLQEAQAAYDWMHDGNNAIISYSWNLYYTYDVQSTWVWFVNFVDLETTDVLRWYSSLKNNWIAFQIDNNWNVTLVSTAESDFNGVHYLDTTVDYWTPYTPQYAWSPATKKYVDDNDTVRKFDLSWTWSTTAVLEEAQAIYDWYNLWKNPLIVYNNYTYVLSNVTASRLEFRWKLTIENQNSSSYTRQDELYINFTSDTVTSVDSGVVSVWWSYLRLGQNYNIPYTPQYDWEPATKKYTDEHGPSIPVYATHWSITGSKTFTVSVPWTYWIILTGVRAGITNRNITISADGTTVATYTAAYAWLVNAHTIITANSSIWITLDTDLTISDIIIEKIDVQTWYISES